MYIKNNESSLQYYADVHTYNTRNKNNVVHPFTKYKKTESLEIKKTYQQQTFKLIYC